MKAVILAGGFGTRISEESHLRPKPMVEIGEQPILWHVMKIYGHYGVTDFVVCAGYKQYMIKEYFNNYYLHRSDITYDFTMDGAMKVHNNKAEPWRVTIADTGLNTMTGGRIKRIRRYVGNEPFFLTYGDGLADVNIEKLLSFHKKTGKTATLTAITTAERFGVIDIADDGTVNGFKEKSDEGNIINGGFMVLEPAIFDYIDGDNTVFEREPLEKLVSEKQLAAYYHAGFWQCMDSMRDKSQLEELWQIGRAPWKVWV